MNKKFDKTNLIFMIMVPLGVIFDQITKSIALSKLSSGIYIPILGQLAGFELTLNDGVAWNMLSGARVLLVLISFAACIGIGIYYFVGKHIKLTKVALSMVFTGALGNGIDRAFRYNGLVVDFIRFNIFYPFNQWGWFSDPFPIFNIADMFVTFGAILLLISILFFEKD